MNPKRKRPVNSSKSRAQVNNQKVQFKPKQSIPPLDLIVNFQFFQKQQLNFSQIKFTILLKDLYPYFKIYSITTCILIFLFIQFFIDQYTRTKYEKYLQNQDGQTAVFWEEITVFFVYFNFITMIGAYLEVKYKFWFVSSFVISYAVGVITFVARYESVQYLDFSHVFTATYSIYFLILFQKKMKLINLLEVWTSIKEHPIWEYLKNLTKRQKKQQNTKGVDFSFTQRPLDIKGGQTDDSFTYDSFFTYNETLELQLQKERNRQRQKYFQSNISQRTSSLTSYPLVQMKTVPMQKFSSQKSLLGTSQIQSLTIQSDHLKNEKKQEQIQLLKIYKCIILSFFIYTSVSRAQWIAYIVSGCGIMGFIEIMTNQKLKMLKFGCLTFLACLIFCSF